MQAVGCGSVNVPPQHTPQPHRSLRMNNAILAIDLGKYKSVTCIYYRTTNSRSIKKESGVSAPQSTSASCFDCARELGWGEASDAWAMRRWLGVLRPSLRATG